MRLRDVLPQPAGLHGHDCTLRNAEQLGNLALGQASFGAQAADLADFILGEFCHWVLLAWKAVGARLAPITNAWARRATFQRSVAVVVSHCADLQVRRIATGWIVAGVHHAHVVGRCAVDKVIGHAMGGKAVFLSRIGVTPAKIAVATISGASPTPTFVWLSALNATPEVSHESKQVSLFSGHVAIVTRS